MLKELKTLKINYLFERMFDKNCISLALLCTLFIELQEIELTRETSLVPVYLKHVNVEIVKM